MVHVTNSFTTIDAALSNPRCGILLRLHVAKPACFGLIVCIDSAAGQDGHNPKQTR